MHAKDAVFCLQQLFHKKKKKQSRKLQNMMIISNGKVAEYKEQQIQQMKDRK